MKVRKIRAVDDATNQPIMDKPDNLTDIRFFAASLASLVVVGFVDYITGYELYMDVFYFIPVSICAWQLRRRDVLVLALLCALTWGFIDISVDHPYSSKFYWYWNMCIKFSCFVILGLVVQRLRCNLKEQARARQELERALAGLRQSTAEIEKLHGQLQVVCAWSQRIRIEGKWMTLEEFLKNHLQIKVSHGISPEAMDKMVKELDETKPKQT
jgi:hypothetical protein